MRPAWDGHASVTATRTRLAVNTASRWANGESHPCSVTAIVVVAPPAADAIRGAHAADLEAIGEILGPLITEQGD